MTVIQPSHPVPFERTPKPLPAPATEGLAEGPGEIATRQPKRLEGPAPVGPSAGIKGPIDRSDCPPRESAEFESADLRCRFPDALPGGNGGNGANVVPGNGANVKTDPTLPREGSIGGPKEKFGTVVSDPSDTLAQRSEALQQSPPETRAEALKAAATQGGLSETTQTAAAELLAALPPEKQGEASAYLEQLLGQRGLGDERTQALLGQLKGMTEQTYDPRAGQNADLVVSALRDVATPLDIDQGINTYTCSATSIQTILAQTNPERYLTMLDTLAQNKPFEGIAPDWSFAEEGQSETTDRGRRTLTADTERSPSSKLMQNAIMEFANGTEDFTSAVDGIQNRPMSNDEAWLAPTLDKVLGDNQNYVMLHVPDGEYPDSERIRNLPAEDILKKLADYGPSPDRPLLMTYSDPEHGTPGNPLGHAALIVGLEGNQVTYVDPIGGVTKSVALEELQKQLWGIQFPVGS